MRQCLHRTRRGFAIKDLCFGLAALAIAAALVITAAPAARKRAQLAAAQNQLRWIAGVTSSYAADFEDRLWGLSWLPGDLPHTNPMLPPRAFSSMDATAIQAIDILHRRAARTDMRAPSSWYAPSLYSHLPLLDYLERDGPDLSFVSPGDEHRLNWTKDPRQLHDTGFWTPFQEPPSLDNKRWPYSASFQAPAALMTQPASGASAVQSGGTHRSYTTPSGMTIGAVSISDIAYPAQKVLLHESATWYTGGPVRLYAHSSAQVNVLAADGAAHMLATAQGNAGWQPANPRSRLPTRFEYRPAAWEGPPPAPTEVLHIAHYRFTRGGPAGRDFGGPEVDTGQ